MVIDEVVWTFTADSAGMVSSLLPVKAAPAVPAPAPTKPPMRAPFPPPASPPMSAPPPVPPPIMTADRLPLPFCVTTYSSVLTLCGTPQTLMDTGRIARIASPLNLPADFASETTPVTPEPAGITTFPLTAIPLANVPVKVCPSWAVLEESVLPMRMVTLVPAGITIGGGGGGGGGGASATGAAAGGAAGVSVGAGAGAAACCPGAGCAVCAGGVTAGACWAGCSVEAGGAWAASSFFLHPAKPITIMAPSKIAITRERITLSLS